MFPEHEPRVIVRNLKIGDQVMVARIDFPSVFQLPSMETNKAAAKDAYDLDIQVDACKNSNQPPVNELITSKSLCTPGCGNTGTYNSYCC